MGCGTREEERKGEMPMGGRKRELWKAVGLGKTLHSGSFGYKWLLIALSCDIAGQTC